MAGGQCTAWCCDRARSQDDPAGGTGLTVLSGLLDEGLHATLAVAALRGQRGHVVPLEGADDVHHGLGLVRVRGHHAGEEVVAAVVTQVRGCGSVADLGDLEVRGATNGGSWHPHPAHPAPHPDTPTSLLSPSLGTAPALPTGTASSNPGGDPMTGRKQVQRGWANGWPALPLAPAQVLMPPASSQLSLILCPCGPPHSQQQ